MLRKLLMVTALLTASGAALAHNDTTYGRVISAEPSVSIAFGSGHYDGFRVLYESGGSRYWTTIPYRPGHVIVLPPHRSVQHGYPYRYKKDAWDNRRHGRHDRRNGHHDYRHDGRY